MSKFYYNYEHYCRWCNKLYTSKKPNPTSGFCSNACKMAHYRAYKKYVTEKRGPRRNAGHSKVTHKTKKK